MVAALYLRRPSPTSTAADAATTDASLSFPLVTELSGCGAILAGPICELPADRSIRVWAAAPGETVVVSAADGRAIASNVVATSKGGAVHRIVVPEGVTEISVARRDLPARSAIEVRPSSTPEWAARAKALRDKGDRAGAAALVARKEASPDARERAFAKSLRARLELAAGNTEASLPLFREAAALHREIDRLSDAADDSFALAFALNQRSHRYTEARKVLDEVRPVIAGYPDGRVRAKYYRGTLAIETGDLRSALLLLRETREEAARLGLALLERNATNAYALALIHIGRNAEARAILDELAKRADETEGVSACEKAEIAINAGYSDLLVAPLERAVALSEKDCADKTLRAAALGNLALASLERTNPPDVAKAKALVAKAREGIADVRNVERLFWHDLEGRIALAEGRGAEALAAFEEEETRARATLSIEEEWRAAVGKGRAHELLGRNDDAARDYRAAETILDARSLAIPLGEGRGAYVGDRAESARRLVELLVKPGRNETNEAALAVARVSRARIITNLAKTARVDSFAIEDRGRWENALGAFRTARAELDGEAKDDWKLSVAEAARARESRAAKEHALRAALDEAMAIVAAGKSRDRNAPSRGGAAGGPTLPRLATDAVTIAYHPLAKGWVAFVADASKTTTFRFDEVPASTDHAALAATLLEPARARLKGAARVRFLPYGAIRAVDLHALPFDGAPLAASVAVDYPVDVATPESATAPKPHARALVISDPSLDLEGTRVETDHVVAALRERGGFTVERLEGTAATSAAVLAQLPQVALLHYAGHGAFRGREGWESALPLAAGGHLAIADVLTAPAIPSRVVLSGCETARTDADAVTETLGLAQAFVIGGASFAIAPTRPVDDTLAARMASALYGELADAGNVDPARALRVAAERLRREDASVDWSAFRVLSR